MTFFQQSLGIIRVNVIRSFPVFKTSFQSANENKRSGPRFFILREDADPKFRAE